MSRTTRCLILQLEVGFKGLVMRGWMDGVSAACGRRQHLRRCAAGLVVMLAMVQGACGGGSAPDSGASPAQPQGVTETSSGLIGSAYAQTMAVQARGQAVVSAPSLTVAMDDLDAIGPFASWGDAKRDHGAKGDGVADDTAALQRALNELGQSGKPSVLYLPAGTYRIASTLRLTGSTSSTNIGWGGVGIVGESPELTRIVWTGPTGEPMLVQNGGVRTRYARITWDGKGTAGYGVAHWWDTRTGTIHDGGPEHQDEVFKDMGIGIMAGRLGAGFGQLNSEGQVRRVTFIRNTKAGVNTGSWNAVNWWVWDSRFVDCARGLSNIFTVSDRDEPGAGGLFVYRSVFQRSTVADFEIANTGFFSMYHNVSIGSRRFWNGMVTGNNSAQIVLKGNRVIDTTDAAAVSNGNVGPLILVDNQFRAKEGVTGHTVVINSFASNREVVSIGNRYTVSNPIVQVLPTDRFITTGDTVVARGTIDASVPSQPATPAWAAHKVHEVPPGAPGNLIQAIINLAAASGDANPVVHFPPGKYTLSAPLVVPARTRIQLVGDALTTIFQWSGPAGGTVFRLEGPSRASLREFQVTGDAHLAVIGLADQPGGRIAMMGNDLGVITASDLSSTRIQLQANPIVGGLTLDKVQSVTAVANGGLGPVQLNGGSRAVITDSWYEGGLTELFRVPSGDLTYVGGHIGPGTHAGVGDKTKPTVHLDRTAGRVAFLGAQFNVGSIAGNAGIVIDNELPETSALFMGVMAFQTDYFKRSGTGGQVSLVMAKDWRAQGVTPLADVGLGKNTGFIEQMLGQWRSMVWEQQAFAAPSGVTDVRIARIKSNSTRGVLIKGVTP